LFKAYYDASHANLLTINLLVMSMNPRIVSALLACTFPLLAAAQDYPSKPVRLLLPVPPGAGTDAVARLLGDKLQAKLGQPFVVEHRAGAGGNLAGEAVYKAAPDGYTLYFGGQSPMVINKNLYGKIPFEPEALSPISMIASGLSILVVNPKVPVTNVPQLIAYAKANPGKLSYASSGSGTIPHLGAELFKSLAGVNILHVPYKGMAPGLADVLGGQVDMMFAGVATAIPHSKDGRIRLIAIGAEKRSPSLPDVPTVAETLPGFACENWFGLLAPPATPAAIVSRLASATQEGLRQPDSVKRLADLGFDTVASTPEELRSMMRAETARWARVIRETGAKAE
jgi:tripartite-type tricarboxylate transporter receptor subunit TctC